MIGQEHVTEPLMAALGSGRINHAYLFSGPRGCGKTTSARILARCLNCAEGPTATPCGRCDSCLELARGGSGSLDVVEMDAASHGGVDDARELRERAAFAPARDRFKVFIIDEAHMVTPQGFNALLKLVEEPPPHVKFVFATTEPEKVIGTIRSRTHHYPFRLVPPDRLTDYLQSLATAEDVRIDSGVLPLVVRAGGGSVRDSLSVLDQLIAGASEGVVGYERAVALLGFTHGTLLDDTIDALAARDGGSLFRVVDRVIGSGHAPRRFVEDLLERLRDLIVVRAAGEHAGSVLRAVPQDQLSRMEAQAGHFGAHALSRSADLVNEALTEMTGATSPQLQLELLCARLLLPAADDGVEGFGARLDRVEGALAGGGPVPAAVGTAPAQQSPRAVVTPEPAVRQPVDEPASAPRQPSPEQSQSPQTTEPARRPEPAQTPEPASHDSASAPEQPADLAQSEAAEPPVPQPVEEATPHTAPDERPTGPADPTPGPAGQPAPESAAPDTAPSMPPTAPATSPSTEDGAPTAAAETTGMTADQVRRRWPEVLETLARLKRITWALISQDAQVVNLTATTLTLGFSTPGLASTFRNGPHADFVARSLQETLGLGVRIDSVVADGSAPPAHGSASPSPAPAPPLASSDWGSPAPGGTTPVQPTTGPSSSQPATQHASSPAAPPWEQRDRESHSGPRASSDDGDTSDAEADPAAPGVTARAAPDQDAAPSTDAARSRDAAPSVAPAPAPADDWPDLPPAPTDWDQEPPPADEPPAPDPGASVDAEPPASAPGTSSARDQAFAAARQARTAPAPRAAQAGEPPHGTQAPSSAFDDDAPSPDDPDIESTGLVGAPLVARLLGGTVIDEIVDHPDGSDQ